MGDEPICVKPASPEQVLFAEALQCATPEARAAYLEAACGTDTALRRRVEVLLRAAENAGDFLAEPPTGLSGDTDSTQLATELISEKPGDRIGRYKLLEQIGEGGCGTVYMAEQEEPVRRRVALKVIKLGMDTRSVVARFEAERQALALMDHPNIAKVLDGGATQTGRPYFVMELVRGVRITKFCDEARLTTEARLQLFVHVCHAIQHAHQKGIIHRDLKPSNILVTVNDGVPVPKVIDFGIAKATGQRLTDKTLFTQFHSFIGTPAYTSPEQAEMSSVDIDTRSDIYSLGVLLYELLTGQTPFDGEELLRSGLDEMRRIIRDDQPPRPSTRLSNLAATDVRRLTSNSELGTQSSEFVAASSGRLLPTKELISAVRGDLDWIVMKCLEKDRARRYETAIGLAADIQRHLDHEPIQARPVNALGRLWRWRRRRPAVATLSASVLLLLLVVAVGSTVSAWRVASARRAEREERTKAEVANRDLRGANTRLANTVSLLELQLAEDRLDANDSATGAAQLTSMLRHDASNHIAADRLVALLLSRNWALPAAAPMRHPFQGVTSVSFSPDGRHVLSASRDKTAQIWDATTGKSLATVHHENRVLAARYNREGDRFVTASEDGTARIWSATNGDPVTPPLRHDGIVTWAEFSPDSRSVVTGSADKIARIWDAASGVLKRELRGHSSGITVARFSPDGLSVATGTELAGLRLWRADTGEVLFRLTVLSGRIHSLAFSPDGSRLASGCADGTARFWNATNGQAMGAPLVHAHDVRHVVFSPDGRLLLTTSDDNSGRLWNVTTGVPVGPPLSHGAGVVFGAFSPDGKEVVTTSMDNSARLWEVARGIARCQPLTEHEAILHASFSPDGRSLVTASWNGIVQVWNIQTRRNYGVEIYLEKPVLTVAFDPRGDSVLSGADQTARLWNARTGQALGEPMRHQGVVHRADYSPDGRRVVTASEDATAHVWDSSTGKAIAGPLQHLKPVWFAQFSPDGERVVTASADGTARLWNAWTGKLATTLEHGAGVNMARFSPDGRWVVTASENRSARVWDAQTGQPVTERLQHIDHVEWAEFSPDSQRVVSASSDNTARIWDARTGQSISPPLQHARTVKKAVFSPDGLRVATASLDRTARIWDARTGEALTAPLRHDKAVSQVYFSPDGRRILTSCLGGRARLWDADTGRPLSEWMAAGGLGFSVCFDSTGLRMVGGEANGIVRVREVPPAPTPVPPWFLAFAEALAGTRISDRGNVELVARQELEIVAQRLAGVNQGGFYERVAQWFFADSAQRPVSPF
jgi:WD40 repeat protein/serine/threonine protein kinase